ncbi:type IV secretion system protein [Bartonella saheliensis]|uniref:type IV secretion system protein n=1 Tax=Bartonella saheliensis TaxID=1457016 RepID=UPI00119CEECC|nr:type IV secretion system protein [Bartonella saheliensis]
MKRLFIITGVIAFLEIQNATLASADFAISAKEYAKIIELIKQQIDLNKRQLHYGQQIYTSISGNRTKPKEKEDNGNLLLSQPNFIYHKNKHDDIIRGTSLTVEDIKKEENVERFTDLHEGRTVITERLHHAAAVDKAVSIEAFSTIERRFEEIAKLLVAHEKVNDLKGIAEIRARMKIMLAMIQNEATKLQMVAHSRNAEQALIKQQKRALHAYSFRKELSTMPKIRINNSTRPS